MEMLSEHTLEGWFEGYVLTGRHGLFATYEAFVHVIDSMFNQHAKWLEKVEARARWRQPVPSINLLITSLGLAPGSQRLHAPGPRFSRRRHQQEPGRGAHLPAAGRELPAERRGSLPASRDYVNVIVADKQPHLQYLDMDAAVTHCTRASASGTGQQPISGVEPDVVIACAGDIATHGSARRRRPFCGSNFPDLKIRFVNVVDLFRLHARHASIRMGCPTATSTRCSPRDKPVIFNFHCYASLIHKLTYSRTNHDNMHVHGYKEKGNINTPLELAIVNQVDRFSLAIDVIDRVPTLRGVGDHRRNGCAGRSSSIWLMRMPRASTRKRSATGRGKAERECPRVRTPGPCSKRYLCRDGKCPNARLLHATQRRGLQRRCGALLRADMD